MIILLLCSYIDRDRSALLPNTLPKQRRVLKELRDLLHNFHPYIRAYPCDTELVMSLTGSFIRSIIVTVSGKH